MGKPYELMLYLELKAEARRRNLPLRGSKAELIRRLVASDQGETYRPENTAPKPPDIVIETAGRGDDNPSQKFNICGGCKQWDRRCICQDGQNTKKPRQSGASDTEGESSAPTGPGTNRRAGRYIHRGTFA